MQLLRLLKGSGWGWSIFTASSCFCISLACLCSAQLGVWIGSAWFPSPPAFFSLNSFLPVALICLEKKHPGTRILSLASVNFCKRTIICGWSFGQLETTSRSAAPVPVVTFQENTILAHFCRWHCFRVFERWELVGNEEKQSQGNTSNYANLRALNLQILYIFG